MKTLILALAMSFSFSALAADFKSVECGGIAKVSDGASSVDYKEVIVKIERSDKTHAKLEISIIDSNAQTESKTVDATMSSKKGYFSLSLENQERFLTLEPGSALDPDGFYINADDTNNYYIGHFNFQYDQRTLVSNLACTSS